MTSTKTIAALAIAGALVLSGCAATTTTRASSSVAASPRQTAEGSNIAREVYDAFQRGELERWDDVFSEDVVINSSANFGVTGIANLKAWAGAFLTGFSPRIDLVDEIIAIDANGNGRAVATINLNWTHTGDFFGLTPSGRSGTSIENLIMTVSDGKVVRMEVADTTLDLVIYMHDRGWVFPQNIRPEPLIRGVERSTESGRSTYDRSLEEGGDEETNDGA